MEAEPHYGVSVTEPLMHGEWNRREAKDVEADNGDRNTDSAASFFMTCFHGLNALSGSSLFLVSHVLLQILFHMRKLVDHPLITHIYMTGFL